MGVIGQPAARLHSNKDGQARIVFVSEELADLDAGLPRSLPGTFRFRKDNAARSRTDPLHQPSLELLRRLGFRCARYDLT
jgi:hypothetical protein